ncbi:MAG: tRNA modification GTPase [Candidatus Deianiraeaceae bacterium]|jgi:tRNA modification GTPase
MMIFLKNMETIFSPINNHRNSAVCTVRISGDHSMALKKFIPSLVKLTHRNVTRVQIMDNNGLQLDDALAVYFKAPHSFTGEDIIEVSLHSSPFIVSQFLSLLSSLNGFRFAKAGEFCLRAVQNNKMSLDEAEAINKLVTSESMVQHRLAINEFTGSYKDYYLQIRQSIIGTMSLLEAYIDFSEDEEIPDNLFTQIQSTSNELVKSIQKTLKISQTRQDCDIQIAILGKPNVGKSSLFNAITTTEDAIVSDISGTTRDAIRKFISINGFKVELIDTAGLRDDAEQIEKIGIERAKSIALQADIILFLQESISENIFDMANFQGHIINVFTKTDIHGVREGGINISQEDISNLEYQIAQLLNERFSAMQSVGFVCNTRQRVILEKSLSTLQVIDYTQSPEIISEEFRHILHTVSELVGGIDTEEILGEIFSSFCIGK